MKITPTLYVTCLRNRLSSGIFRSSIANKMMLGYLPLVVIIVLISFYTLSRLSALGDLSMSIVDQNMAALEAAEGMTNSLLAQEAYGRRYLILKSREMESLFWKRDAEFQAHLDVLKQIPGATSDRLTMLESFHKTFNRLYRDAFARVADAGSDIEKNNDIAIQGKLDAQLEALKAITAAAKSSLEQKTRMAGAFTTNAFRVVAVLSVLGIIVGLGAALLITRSVSRSIKQLKLATAKFSEREFDFVPDVTKKDEFGMLARSFAAMAQRLARLEMMDLDASPLTRLPGGISVENVLETRLAEGTPLAFCLADIDNFKSFNDRYGYARGNEVIKATAGILSAAIANHGTENAFLGHIGGDDFAVIVHPDRYPAVCQAAIDAFDKTIGDFYDETDRFKGYITARNRQGKIETFPIMSLSIAVVTNTGWPDLNSVRCGEIAAEIKEYAKTISGSMFIADRRKKITEQPGLSEMEEMG
ncbi:MAG: diguanylate cyclase [Thermodesulfobacteriota bacterium]|nr:diguanylate cyclase [Thermodesulfobacteriota bacterium]